MTLKSSAYILTACDSSYNNNNNVPTYRPLSDDDSGRENTNASFDKQSNDAPVVAGNVETLPAADIRLLYSTGNSTIDTSNVTALGNGTQTHNEVNDKSLALPQGLAMDPLAPAALAISSELMERLGSGLSLLRDHGKKVQKYLGKTRKIDLLTKSWKSLVTIVLVDAKELPDSPTNGSNGVYCKIKLGAECHKSKQVSKTSRPSWRERFNLHMYDESNLELTVQTKTDKGRQKQFMGRCTLDLSQLEKEKTHEFWLQLECGYGSVHLLVTLNGSPRSQIVDSVPTTTGITELTPADDNYVWYRLADDWSNVGQLTVTLHGARGLSALGISGKADAYCVLELDNSRVQTHTVRGTNDPGWNKSYSFSVNDITSTLDITVYDESIISSLKGEMLGKLTIPLLRINNGETRWYALKNRSRRSSAKGNCPRVQLSMTVAWNPVKAAARVLSPKGIKYIEKPPKFDIPLLYSNVKFIRDIFVNIVKANEYYKYLFEWENREMSTLALLCWLTFWYFFRLWMLPLLLVVPFLYHWTGLSTAVSCRPQLDNVLNVEEEDDEEFDQKKENDKNLKYHIHDLHDMTFTIKKAIDYIVSIVERIKNLANFTVPYLSYLAVVVLIGATFALYVIPVHYIFMALGLYKYTRKILYPERVPNNDLLDFISRVPDNVVLKKWKELKVPEPSTQMMEATKEVNTS